MKRLILISLLIFMSCEAFADIKEEVIDYRHGDVVLQGYLVHDDSSIDPQPGVLLIHEWWGLNDYAKRRARELAEEGFIVFALDMYGNGIVAKDPAEAREFSTKIKKNRTLMRERARAGLDILAQNPLTDSRYLAVMGYCFGGTVALELARSGAPLKGTVSFHGNLDTPPGGLAKNIKGKILVLHGADDPYVPEDEVKAFKKEMNEAGVDWQLNEYSDAVHSFTNINAGHDNSRGAAYNEKADKRSWTALLNFLEEVFMQVTLEEQIKIFKEKGAGQIPEETRNIMHQAMEGLRKLDLEENSLKVGDKMPSFSLPNAVGKNISSDDLLGEGPLVISFYRGHWCPYCNLELSALQESLPEINKLGANLVAISPNLPDKSLTTKEKLNLEFEVLTDKSNKVAHEFGLVFILPQKLRPVYESFGIDLAESNGDDSFELPIPATFIVDKNGIIQHAFVNMDYSIRLEPDAIISFLRNLKD